MKLLIIGFSGHGKDTVAKILSDKLSLSFSSSSKFACEQLVFPNLKNIYGYRSPDECFNDRDNHRVEWFNLISYYNQRDPTRLARELLQQHDIYVGMRNAKELTACLRAELFDLVIWVDASQRLPKEALGSCTVDSGLAHMVLDNNVEGLDKLNIQVTNLVNQIKHNKIDWLVMKNFKSFA